MELCAADLSSTTRVAPLQPWVPAPTLTRYRLLAERYRVERILGQGGAAVVYRVMDTQGGGRLALKQLLPHGRRLPFRREFHTLASLRHPNIITVHEFGHDGERLYYTMELLDGRPIAGAGRLPPRQVCQLLRDVGSALAFLHARRLIHGDISRRNIGCTADGTIKLLDFGLLATIGVTGKGGGTVPYVAPEVQRGMPLDHRVDLFSLGALAYRLLTGRSAYRASHNAQLERAWSLRPPSPSELDRSIPGELGDLVLSMISVNPLARPSSAAEVIDRARAIARLPRAAEGQVVRGYLSSSALVGRSTEMRELRQAVADARQGRGGTVLLRGSSGMGKTRILAELRVEAQLAGAQILSARCEVDERAPYGALRSLVRPLVPGDVRLANLEQWAGIEHSVGAEQRRLLLQRRLAARILAEADRRPLVLLIDDLQRCDEASAAVLAAVAHQARVHRVVLVVTLRSDEPQLAPGAVATIELNARDLALRGLNAAELRELLRATFGAVDNLEPLARWIHGASDGSPLQCTELARFLVDRGILRYEDGIWQIPSTIGNVAPPGALVEVLERRVATLSPLARRLAEALSVLGGEIGLELCVALAGEESAAFAALDELVEQEVLVGVGERLRFRHDGLRETLLRSLETDRRRDLHLVVGRLLEEQGASDEEVGWHLLEGGEELRAADRLERAGRRHFEDQAFASAGATLEAALRVLERHGGTVRRCAELRELLVRAGVICDRALVLRHGERAVADLREHSGARLADELRRYVGRHLGLIVALLLMSVRWLFVPRSRRGPHPLGAVVRLVTMVNCVAVVKALSFDLEGARRTTRGMEAVVLLSRRWSPYGSYLLGTSIPLMLVGRFRQARSKLEQLVTILESTWLPIRSRFDLSLALGAGRYALASIAAQELDGRCLEEFERLGALRLNFFEASARLGRLIFHRTRGEEDRARALEEEMSLLFVQTGSMWPWESQLRWISALAHCAARDLTAMKRGIADIELLVAQGLRLEPVLEICRGTYQAERGDLESARRILSALLETTECRRNPLFLQAGLAALGHVLIGLGRPREARDIAARGVRIGENPETCVRTSYIINVSNLALAEALLGETDHGARRIDRALREIQDSPMGCGTLHEARTRVALLAGDPERVRHHLAETEYWYRITRNPALIARYEKLAAQVCQGRRGQT